MRHSQQVDTSDQYGCPNTRPGPPQRQGREIEQEYPQDKDNNPNTHHRLALHALTLSALLFGFLIFAPQVGQTCNGVCVTVTGFSLLGTGCNGVCVTGNAVLVTRNELPVTHGAPGRCLRWQDLHRGLSIMPRLWKFYTRFPEGQHRFYEGRLVNLEVVLLEIVTDMHVDD